MCAYHRGDHATAARCLEAAAQRNGAEAVLARFYGGQAYYQLGLADLRRREFACAIDHFKMAMGFNPKAEGLAKFLGACYAAMGDLDQAGQHFGKLLQADPKADDVRIRTALIQWKSGKYDAAIDTLREGVRVSPDEPELQYQLGVMLGASEQYDEAVGALTEAHRLRPKHADTWVKLGWCEGARGNARAAYDHLARAHGLAPRDAAIAMQMTMAAQAVVQNGGHVRTDQVTADLNDRIDDSGVEVLGEMIARDSDFAEAMLSLEESDLDREVFSVIVQAIQAALARHPQYADLHYHCSRVHERLGNTEQAIDASERALRINPRYIKALVQLARLYTQTDQRSDAISRLEQAIEAGGTYPDIYFMLGNLYRDAGKTDRARAAYESALALNEHYTAASVALADLAA
jgi:tetratricopeptide (TPR) repeat protein